MVREIELLANARVTILSDRRIFSPYGLQGGSDGRAGLNFLLRDGESLPLPGKASFGGRAGDVVRIETPGGGGLGRITSS
jgi:N-methylhydantoinase B